MATRDHYDDPTIGWFLEFDGTIHFVDERCKAVDRILDELGVRR